MYINDSWSANVCKPHIFTYEEDQSILVPTDIEKTVTAALKVVLTDSKFKNQTIFILHIFFFNIKEILKTCTSKRSLILYEN